MKFSIMQIFALLACICVGMVAMPAMASFFDGAEIPEHAKRKMAIGGAFVGTVYFFTIRGILKNDTTTPKSS